MQNTSRCFRLATCLTLILLLSVGASFVRAHASLDRADPSPNARLGRTPDAFHLWFTEPVEPEFSRVALRDSSGALVESPPAAVSADGMGMTLTTGDLPDGVYTVVWRVVSAADGHPTQGSYPVVIGAAAPAASLASDGADAVTIPIDSAAVRWINLISLALLGGLPAFALWVCRDARTERRLWALSWTGWLAVGAASILLLLLQTAILAGEITPSALANALFSSRFGALWLARIALWVLYGLAVMLLWQPSAGSAGNAPRRRAALVAGVMLAAGIQATQSLFSHAAGVEANAALVIAADWLHLIAMSAWVGGLVGVIAAAPLLHAEPAALGRVVARFSNLARAAVALLIVTGASAALAQVGSFEALTTTAHGAALIVKLILLAPLLLIAAVNLLLTGRRLRAGAAVWAGRLRLLAGVELALALAILVAAGLMTAIPPARVALAERLGAPPPPDSSYFEMEVEGGVMVHLTITPGLVGENTFIVELLDDATGAPITDASLIRLRLEHRTANLGESELRPVHEADGRYVAVGSNLSLPGDWRVRITVQRPDQFDTLVDFAPSIPAAAPPVESPESASQNSSDVEAGDSRDAVGDPVRLVPARSGAPWLITSAGALFRPGETGGWAREPLAAQVRDATIGFGGVIWAAADEGVYRSRDGVWERISDFPARTLVSTHGYLFALGAGGFLRAAEGVLEQDVRQIDAPESDQRAADFVMLGSHSHALLNGTDVYMTGSLGLGWTPLDAPADVRRITTDAAGNLLAVGDATITRWEWSTNTWSLRLALGGGAPIDELVEFKGALYGLSEGQVVRLMADGAREAAFASEGGVSDMAFQYPDTLWALDAAAMTLVSTRDGCTWSAAAVTLAGGG
ncbi:MAG: copper resistance protein CopC [Anaerolineae bacterium]|nr:copper resistance protein CopC [Anaerolineae bacterium]